MKAPLSTLAPIVVVVGPTAGGKTTLAVELALATGGECISADSMQVYRGMDIGTAKPSSAERRGVPHHLIDIVDPTEDGFTVDAWLERAESTIAEVRLRGNLPIVVGGTNLYVRALLEGLFEGPEPSAALRRELEETPLTSLRDELGRVDPVAAQRIHANDRRRSMRAIEVYRQTGTPLSKLQTQWSSNLVEHVRGDAIVIGLDWPVDAINRRINARVRAMMTAGFLDEVRTLRSSGPLGRQAREAVGYGELLEHLDGSLTLEEATERIKIRSRRYGKQQRTWLRRFRAVTRSHWIDAATTPVEEWLDRSLAALKSGAHGGASDEGSAARPEG
ncbi:MAG: tRNA (adenosine(37)-N6)-dimethylallyltransferase MiaA [Phycisphaerae bacterium]|nr:tRNA (adenosine(37)-N6)-dimethylallyltransferase MiaA [Phycisphaerae bacterium]